MLKSDKKIRAEMIQKEKKTKIYMIKTGFNELEGFHDIRSRLKQSISF